MLNLQAISGLPLSLDDAGQMIFDPAIDVDETKVRLMDELTPVALSPEVCRGNPKIAYYMYNGVSHRDDTERLAGVPIRYELTLIPARRLDREFVKTFGHLHTTEPGSGLTYPEVCEVLVGTAHFVFQTLDPTGPDAGQTFYIEAKAGDKIIIPPDFDHLTINPGPGPLLFSDVMGLEVRGIYERYRMSRGAAYLEIIGADEQPQFIANPHYRLVAPLQKLSLKNYPGLDLTTQTPLYTAFVQGRGENWPFLTAPGQFWPSFPDLAAQFKTR